MDEPAPPAPTEQDAAAVGAPPATSAPPPSATAEGARVPTRAPGRLLTFVRRMVPWISLAIGAVSAVLMDRSADNAWVAALAAVLCWLTLVSLQWFRRVDAEGATGTRRAVLGAARFSSLMLTQSLIQLTLFFALPFYLKAATLDPGHVIFVGGLCVLALASLWDPLTAWLLARLGLSALLPMAGSFAALTAVLPGLGLSTRMSLWVAAFVATAGVPFLAAAQVGPERRKLAAVLAGVLALALPGSLLMGGARFVPAAPLELVKGEIGTRRDGKWIADAVEHLYTAPEHLICATAIYAPLGLRDRLFHEWRKNGQPRTRVELEIVGGRAEGYRTQSRIGNFAPGEQGTFSCSVVTATGQLIGTRSIRIGRR